jgi:hypothetical protein
MSFLSYLCVRSPARPHLAPSSISHKAVFQPKLDILGMVIYATEFVLWCGVFACGGYFNLMPWVRQKIRNRRREREEERSEDVGARDEGISNDISLQHVPSSTSVFITPSSVEGDGVSLRSRTVD